MQGLRPPSSSSSDGVGGSIGVTACLAYTHWGKGGLSVRYGVRIYSMRDSNVMISETMTTLLARRRGMNTMHLQEHTFLRM